LSDEQDELNEKDANGYDHDNKSLKEPTGHNVLLADESDSYLIQMPR
jgi:hypothetical protein